MNNQIKLKTSNTNWKYILIVVILAIIVGGGILGYKRNVFKEIISLTKFPEIKKPEKIVKDETANWETYRNEEYGFEIKYPKDFSLQEIFPSESIQFNSLEHFQIGWHTVDFLEGKKISTQECLFGQELSDKNMFSPKGVKEINGRNFYYYVNYPKYINNYCGMSGGCSYRDLYRTYYGGYCHEIILYTINGAENNETASKIFNQILSTFRFLG